MNKFLAWLNGPSRKSLQDELAALEVKIMSLNAQVKHLDSDLKAATETAMDIARVSGFDSDSYAEGYGEKARRSLVNQRDWLMLKATSQYEAAHGIPRRPRRYKIDPEPEPENDR